VILVSLTRPLEENQAGVPWGAKKVSGTHVKPGEKYGLGVFKQPDECLGAAHPVDGRRHDPTGVAGALAHGVEPRDVGRLQGQPVAEDSHRTRTAGFRSDDDRLRMAQDWESRAEVIEPVPKCFEDPRRQELFEGGDGERQWVGRIGQSGGQATLEKVDQSKRRGPEWMLGEGGGPALDLFLQLDASRGEAPLTQM